MKDEDYIIDLCDEVIGHRSQRQHRFPFLRGDGNPGTRLPVDAYYPMLDLVIEYRERQHGEAVPLWDKKPTKSGIPRGEQRARYDQRRREILSQNGIALVELSYADFDHDGSKRLRRDQQTDKEVLRRKLSSWIKTNAAG